MNEPRRPRVNQRLRTRRDLLRAAAALSKTGERLTMEAIAEKAMVSRATAYRYFPNLESLLVEAPLENEPLDADTFFETMESTDVVTRLQAAESALHELAYRNEPQLRLMMSHILARSISREPWDETPLRQSRRTEFIEHALAAIRQELGEERFSRLVGALALVLGTESLIVFRDVYPISEDRAKAVKQWMVKCLTEAAINESESLV